MTTKIALLQMTSGIDPATNAATISQAAHEAAAAGGPCCSRRKCRRCSTASESGVVSTWSPNPIVPLLLQIREAARSAGIWIHLGSLPVISEVPGEGWRNRSLVVDNQGMIRARYDKLHLFDVDLPTGERWRESSAYSPGQDSVLLDSPAGQAWPDNLL